MLGAAIGNIIGLRGADGQKARPCAWFDHHSTYGTATICTAAVGDWILHGCSQSPAVFLQKWCRRYPHPHDPYSLHFGSWLWQGDPEPYGSLGAGAAMRVSAVGWAFNSLSETLNFACDSAAVTHDHTEGIKGAQAVAAAIFWARTGESKAFIRDNTARLFGYDVGRSIARVREGYRFHHNSPDIVPPALCAFLDSETFEDALRLAVSLGGNTAAVATITASVAEAYYRGIAPHIKQKTLRILPDDITAVLLNLPT
ncbi:ADP-ribosylglycohydrolase family protein [Conchiformibius kuhniae]|uniref:ADP-ribosylglycohydrolase family protein n=1 Tax=Conchiformibius kuhniae TaxID=211502 RepID=A0A8T9MTS5_9NEIS|nr:ADP-ribosylglycohydrolase family protein [Conchiformibius kuhniae]UOP04494.1 ADP-ribosylglycohydrolase family protein [Conchiformibius kuhniae]